MPPVAISVAVPSRTECTGCGPGVSINADFLKGLPYTAQAWVRSSGGGEAMLDLGTASRKGPTPAPSRAELLRGLEAAIALGVVLSKDVASKSG